jgi:hypothetical protein
MSLYFLSVKVYFCNGSGSNNDNNIELHQLSFGENIGNICGNGVSSIITKWMLMLVI